MELLKIITRLHTCNIKWINKSINGVHLSLNNNLIFYVYIFYKFSTPF